MDTIPWITYDSSHRGNILTYHKPPQHVTKNVGDNAKPSYITFLGKRSKAILLDQILGSIVDVPVHRQVYLWCSPRLRSGSTPIVVIDCNVQNTTIPDPTPVRQTRDGTVLTISNTNNIGATLCGNIFSLFSSVICCFVDDLGGIRAVADWLAEQLVAMPASDSRIVPRILLVIETSSESFDEIIAANKATNLVIAALEGKKDYSNAQHDTKQRLGEINALGLQSSKPTAVRGLVVIGMFLLQWSASESLEKFEDVASKTFGRRKAVVTRALQLFMGYIQDGQYSSAAIQDAFRKALNSPLQMFNPLRNDTKVAVTTTTVKDSLPWLFTNYNGGKRSNNIGYDVIRAYRAESDITVSDAAVVNKAALVLSPIALLTVPGSSNPKSYSHWELFRTADCNIIIQQALRNGKCNFYGRINHNQPTTPTSSFLE
ncbi:hypothetical protein BM1_10004 [Bipolaris maydis]|nr:hypothetical protein BM1_10004 [Bipolaris maydis]